MKKNYKLIRINKKGEYVFKEAKTIDIIIGLPRYINYLFGEGKPLIIKRMSLPSRKRFYKNLFNLQ